MEIHRKRFKGSFLSFFDWNAKYKKKQLSDDPMLPEISKQGKENVDNLPKSEVNMMKMNENGANPRNNAGSDFDCAISISSSDEGFEIQTKAPGLLARLMGLDSLPVSNVSELSSSSTSLHGSSHIRDADALDSMVDYCCHVDSINMGLMSVKSSWSVTESKERNHAVKRFQTEMLPPRCAKTIPVTHNKLLSPIKSPGYMQPKHAAKIMEAAAKIIEASSQLCKRNRMSSAGCSSVPSRILELKEKLEASQYESKFIGKHSANPLNGKPSERRNSLCKSTPSLTGSRDLEKNSSCKLPSKRKSASLAIPSRTNVQSCDELTLNGNRGCVKQKEHNDVKSNQLSRNQKKRSTDRARVIQQKACTGKNNQKLCSETTKGNSASKAYSHKPKQTWSSESSTRAKKTTKRGVVKANTEAKGSDTRVTGTPKSVSKRKSISQKKNYINRDVHSEGRGTDTAANSYENKSIKCNLTTDGSINQDVFSMKGSNGVISFTFTSPLRRKKPELQSSTEKMVETRRKTDVNSCSNNDMLNPRKSSLSPPRLHVIDGEALSVLLERKLQELTSRINPTQCSLMTEWSSAGLEYRSFHPNCQSDNMVLSMNQQPQTSESIEGPSCSSNSESRNESYLDSAYGGTVYSSMQDEEVSDFSPMDESLPLENEAEWSEQSSSTVMGDNIVAIEQSSIMSNSVEFTRSSRNLECEYVKDILNNAELMTEKFVMGETDKIIMPNLFDLLETKSNVAENYEKYSKIERKVIFDTVSECLELRCRQVFVGSCKAMPKWVASVQKKSSLAEDLYKEMLNLRSMEELVVEELVCKDMNTPWGRWLEFDAEAFEEGLELEVDVVTCLINELVSDLLQF